MYNGIGLNTPRGSGTSGHITRNLSSIRPRDDYRSMGDRDMPVQHRAPDAAILEHERKRRIEVQCLELQDSLEEKGAAPEDVEAQVDQLRQTLTAQARSKAPDQPAERGAIKDFQRHELLAAKAVDNARFERAFNISRDYVEGESLNKEKQEERRAQRQLDKERRNVELAERKRLYEAEQEKRQAAQVQREATDRAARAADAERHRIEVESRAKDRESRMRDIQREREADMGHSAPRARNDLVDSYRPGSSRGEASRRSRSPPPRRSVGRRDRSYSRSRSRSAGPRRESRTARSTSRSPPRRDSDGRGRLARSASRSRLPPPRRGRSRTRSYSRSSSSRSPSPRRNNGASRRRSADSRSVSPARRRSSPPRRPASPGSRSQSRSPRARQRSATGSEDMDVQSD